MRLQLWLIYVKLYNHFLLQEVSDQNFSLYDIVKKITKLKRINLKKNSQQRSLTISDYLDGTMSTYIPTSEKKPHKKTMHINQ